jgi:predicted TPR repeat methyltransferase
MILIALFLAAADPAPLSIDPFMDEPTAAKALEAHLTCLAHDAFERRDDSRDPRLVAADAVNACRNQAHRLSVSLAEVYSRKPNLLPAGKTPEQAADAYVAQMNDRTELVIKEGRVHK